MADPVSRPGRDLERLVATIERSLGDGPIVVKSPEFIVGRISHTKREVDVSVRGTLGSAEIFVMVECRKRSRAASVEWIDQAAKKAEDVGASKLVLVSAKGFSKKAREYADRLGIEIRELQELSSMDVLGWVAEAFRSVTLIRHRVEILAVTMHLASDPRDIEPIDGSPPALAATTPMLRRTKDGTSATANDAWNLIDQTQLYEGAGHDRQRKGIRAQFPNRDDRFAVQVRGEWFEVEEIEFGVDLWVEIEQTPVTPFRYANDGVTLSEGFSWEWDLGRGPQRAALTRTVDEEGSTMITYSAEPRPEQEAAMQTIQTPFDFAEAVAQPIPAAKCDNE